MNHKDLDNLIRDILYEAIGNLREKSVPQPYDRSKARDMTKSQITKRDKIGKKMLKNKKVVARFTREHGDEWEDYLWATATSIAMKGE